MDHNSRAFHDELGKLSPEDAYAQQLDTAIMAVREFGVPPAVSASAYQVNLNDLMRSLQK